MTLIKKISILFLLLHLAPVAIKGQDSLNISDRLYLDGKALAVTAGNTFLKPFHWDKHDFLNLSYVAAGAGLIYIFDEEISLAFKRNRSDFFDGLEEVGDHFGRPVTGTGLTLALFSYGVVSSNRWSRETATLLGSTMLVSGLIQTASKTLVGRARPASGRGKFKFKPFAESSAYHSFPSGHTTVAFSTALVLAHRIDSFPVTIGLYTLGSLTALSRIYNRAHWPTDIFLGGALTWFAFKANLTFLSKNRSIWGNNLIILPDGNGIRLALIF